MYNQGYDWVVGGDVFYEGDSGDLDWGEEVRIMRWREEGAYRISC